RTASSFFWFVSIFFWFASIFFWFARIFSWLARIASWFARDASLAATNSSSSFSPLVIVSMEALPLKRPRIFRAPRRYLQVAFSKDLPALLSRGQQPSSLHRQRRPCDASRHEGSDLDRRRRVPRDGVW